MAAYSDWKRLFVYPPLTRMKKETSARSCLPFVSICPKLWMAKYQDHLALDGISLRMLNRKTNTIWKGFSPYSSEIEIQSRVTGAVRKTKRIYGKIYIILKSALYGFTVDVPQTDVHGRNSLQSWSKFLSNVENWCYSFCIKTTNPSIVKIPRLLEISQFCILCYTVLALIVRFHITSYLEL